MAARIALMMGMAATLALPTATVTTASSGTSTVRVGGYAIRWPTAAKLRALKAGDTVKVVVSRSGRRTKAPAVVALVRVSRNGKALRLVGSRTMLHSGTFSARLPGAGHYRLRVRVGGAERRRDFAIAVPDPASDEPDAASSPAPSTEPCGDRSIPQGTLTADPGQARPGQTVALQLTNTGSVCAQAGYQVDWQASSNGSWTTIDLHRQWPAATRLVAPGGSVSDQFPIPDDATPGAHRVLKRLNTGGTPIEVTAQITVVN